METVLDHPTVGYGTLHSEDQFGEHVKLYDVLMVSRNNEPGSDWLVLGRSMDQWEWETLAIYPTEQMASRMIQSILRSNPDAYYSP